MIGRFRQRATRATVEERRFDELLADLLAGRRPVDVPDDDGDDLAMAQELNRHLSPLRELPLAVETRLHQKIDDGIVAQERRPLWRRSFATHPARLATVAALVVVFALGMLSPVGRSARATANDVWFEVVGGEKVKGEPVTSRPNADGSVTIYDQDGNSLGTLHVIETQPEIRAAESSGEAVEPAP
jgi:hypothetical protein